MNLLCVSLALFTANFCGGVIIQQHPLQSIRQKTENQANLTCHHDDSNHYYMFWYRQHGTKMELLVYSSGPNTATIEAPFKDTKYNMNRPNVTSSSLEIKNVEVADSAVYYCASSSDRSGASQAYFGGGTRLTVLDPKITVTEPTVKVLPPSTEEGKGKGKKKTLVCVATGFYPDHVTVSWTKNEEDVDEGVGTDSEAKRDDNTNKYSITSRLKVLNTEWHKRTNEFKCTVFFYNGSVNKTVSNKINGNPDGAEYEAFNFESLVKSSRNAKLAYIILIAKSTFYGFVIMALIWKFQGSSEKRCN